MKNVTNRYTIFGSTGFFGKNLYKVLKEKKKKIYIPKKNKYIFNKNLGNVIYCIGTSESIKNPKNALTANLEILSNLLTFEQNEKGAYFKSLKLAAESLCLQMNNPNIKIIRLANLFGYYFTNQVYLLPTLLRQSIKKGEINIIINKNSRKNYLSVNDAIDVILKIITKSKYQVYNVASDKQISINQISEKIRELTNCKINYKNSNLLLNEPKINIQRIKKEFNFKPKIELTNEIEKIIYS